ncbi:MAG: hypothetical protein NVSMB47_13760 [Polyangiales bacterium]
MLVVSSLAGLGCPKAEEKKDTPAAADKKGGDDDSSDDPVKKKGKKKKDDVTDDDDSAKDKKKKPDDPALADDALDGGRIEDGGTVAKTPVPAGCAPDASGKLGAKPRLVASAGEPGAAIAVWAKGGETAATMFAVTLHADGKCYVDYVSFGSTDPTQTFVGFDFPKGTVAATAGVAERGSNSFVGFRVLYGEPQKKGGELHTESFARFYGYEHAEGEPYSCAAIAGGKGCAMYQKPLVAHVGTGCTAAKGGGPPVGAPTIGGGVANAGKLPTIGGTISGPRLDPGVLAIVDAGVDAGTCNGPTCATSAFMVKEKDHVYVRVAAGKPTACDPAGGPRVGDTWFFADSAWKKR